MYIGTALHTTPPVHQLKTHVQITNVFKFQLPVRSLISNSASVGDVTTLTLILPQTNSLTEVQHATNLKKNAYRTKKCRYCPNLERSGKITCTITITTYTCKAKGTLHVKVSISLIYAIYGITFNMCDKPKEPYWSISKGTMQTQAKDLRELGTNPQLDPHKRSLTPTSRDK